MYIVKPLIDDGKLKLFLTAKAAIEWAQTGAYRETGADVCEVYWVADHEGKA